jgi:4-amino-4-deoxychorismate lyase
LTTNSFLETIKIQDGEVYNLSYHQKRYEGVLRSLGILDFQNLSSYISPPLEGLYRCRLVYDTSGNIEVTYHPYVKRTIQSLKIFHADTLEYSKKYTFREDINSLFEKRENCDDVLFVKNDLITDTSIANIALFKDGFWFTPASPLLEGTTRARYIDAGILRPQDIKVQDLHNFSQIALLNAMIDFDIITDIRYN